MINNCEGLNLRLDDKDNEIYDTRDLNNNEEKSRRESNQSITHLQIAIQMVT